MSAPPGRGAAFGVLGFSGSPIHSTRMLRTGAAAATSSTTSAMRLAILPHTHRGLVASGGWLRCRGQPDVE